MYTFCRLTFFIRFKEKKSLFRTKPSCKYFNVEFAQWLTTSYFFPGHNFRHSWYKSGGKKTFISCVDIYPYSSFFYCTASNTCRTCAAGEYCAYTTKYVESTADLPNSKRTEVVDIFPGIGYNYRKRKLPDVNLSCTTVVFAVTPPAYPRPT